MIKTCRTFAQSIHKKITGTEAPSGFFSATFLLASIISGGTIFYHYNQGWSYIDSLYFSIMTVTTVGYGDFHPTNNASKVFTMLLVLLGAGLGVYIISTFAASIIEGRKRRLRFLDKFFKTVTQ